MFQNHPHLVQGIGCDGELAQIEQFVCHLYGTSEQPTVDNVRLQLFGKAKLGLEMLPPTRDALELHTARANYQAKIWLQADQEHINIQSKTTKCSKQFLTKNRVFKKNVLSRFVSLYLNIVKWMFSCQLHWLDASILTYK